MWIIICKGINMTERHDSELLREFLGEREVVCPSCRYSLRNCEADRCPECGASLELGLVEARSAATIWWAGALAGCSISAFILTVLLLNVLGNLATAVQDPRLQQLVAAGFVPASDGPRWMSMIVLSVLTIVALTTVVWLLAVRRQWRASSRRSQVILGITGAASPLLFLGVIAFLLRFVL